MAHAHVRYSGSGRECAVLKYMRGGALSGGKRGGDS